MKKASAIIALIQLFLISSALAQTPEISNGLSYLTSTQRIDGSWGDGASSAEALPTTASVIEAMQDLNETASQNYSNAVAWLQAQSLETSDYLARRIQALPSAGTDNDILVSYIDEIRFAWGGEDDYLVNNLDTTLALRALKAIDYPDQDLISSAIWYLLTTQNTDGGWGFYEGTESNVYMTALVSSTLQQFTRSTLIASAINNATGYLLTKQNADGGFGSSPSTAYESAFAYMAIAGEITDETVLGNAVNYIKTTQLADGSWNADPYSTALALKALYVADINPPTPPVVPTTGSITGAVVDSSNNQPLDGVSVVLMSDPLITVTTDAAGSFTLPDVPEGSQTVTFSIAGFITAEVPVDVTAGSILNIGTVSLPPSPATGIIKGTVTDADTGSPLEGVSIIVSGSYSGSVLTDTNGKFTINGVTPGSVTLDASLPGYYSVTGTGTVNAGGTLLFNPQLSTQPPSATTGSLTGIVVDSATSTPVTSAQIIVSGINPIGTDAQGAFLIENIDPGAYTVTISVAGYTSQEFQVIISAGVTTSMQTIYLAAVPISTTINGTVTDASTGTPVAGADIIIPGTALSATTNASGTYTIQSIDLLNFDIHASATGYNSAAFHISTSGFGVYKIDFMLFPSSISTLQITSVTTDKTGYTANEDVLITAAIENQGAAEVQGTVSAEIVDSDGEVIALMSAASPDISVLPSQTIQSEINWNTGQFPTGEYFVRVRVHDPNTVTPENPTGNLLAEKVAVVSLTSSQELSGSLSLTPPVTQVDMQIPVEIRAAVRNTGNTVINTALHLEVALNSSVVYATDIALSGLHVNEVQEFDFGSFIPQAGGDYTVTLTPEDTAILSNITKILYVGDHASAEFTVNPAAAIAGDANVTGKITLKGISTATGAAGDPLVPLIKDAIQKGILWEQENALSWQTGKQCYGCHVQTQTIIGAELSRGKVLVHDDKTNQLLDYVKSCQGADGIVKHRPNDATESMPITSTTFFAWSLAYYHYESQIQDSLIKAVDYLITQQDATGSWISDDPNEQNHWWNDFGWTQPSTPFTAYNIIALVKAYQLTGNQAYKDAVISAVNFLLSADHTTGSVTASHIIMGLKSALPIIDDSGLASSMDLKTESAITYLTNNQNADGGWGMQSIDPSDSLLSAHVLYAMSLAGISGSDPSLRNGTTYLLNSQNPDGTWSTQFVRLQTYPDRHFAATTWAIISLPSTLETIAGVSADVSVTFGPDIVLNGSSLIPSGMTTSGGGTTYQWDFQGLNEEGKDLYLDLTVSGLKLGETRTISREAYISFENEYGGTTNDIPIDIPAVTGIAPFNISVSADKPEYAANEDVTATATIHNISPELKNPEVHFSVEDPQGNIVENAGVFQVDNLAPQHNPPYLTGWNNRIKLTIDHTAVDSDLTDFPVRIHLSNASGITASDVSDIFNQLTLASVDDDFTGADGDFPDSDKWSISYFAEISNGQMRIPSKGAYRPVTSKFSLYNDFDIQVDYGFDQYPGDVASWESIFKIRDGIDSSGKQLQISRRFNGVHDIAFNKRVSGSWSTVGAYNTTEQSGKFRFTRVANVFTAYYWDGTGWTSLGSYTYGSWSDSAVVEFASNSFSTNPENVVLFDNFTVNAGQISYSGYSKKIAVTTSDGKTQSYVEIENWDDINNEANLWVKVPLISSAADTTLYLYYDSSQPLNTEYVGNTGEYPARKVWDNGYVSVYHMAQSPSDSAPQIKDSTENANSGTASYSMNSGHLVDGQIGKAIKLSFDTRDAIDLGASPDFDVTAQLTIEAIVKPSQFTNWDRIVSKSWSADVYPWNTYTLNLTNNDTGSENVNFSLSIGGTAYGVDSVSQISPNQSAYTAGIYDGVNQYIYFDGQMENSAPLTGAINVNSTVPVMIGKNYWNFYNSFNGEIDEVRISSVGRSPEWIKATYYSHYDNLISFGPVLSSNNIDPASSQSFTIIWNTGITLSGDYRVKATVTEGGAFTAESLDDFIILPDMTLSTSVTTDKIEYNANENTLITSAIQNEGVNYIYEDLTATVTVKDSSSQTLHADNTAISILTPASYHSIKTYWNTATSAPGVYPVTLEVKDSSGSLLSTSTTDLTISSEIVPSKLLLGSITVDQQSLLQGTPVNISYSITNAGNVDLSQVDISIPVVHVVEMTPYDTLTDQASLLMGDSFTNSQSLGTQTYTAKDYLVVLRATISGVEETLAATYFRVEGAPSPPSLNWPIHGEDVETLIPELIVNNATDPNDDELTYEFELYADSGLTTLLASQSGIAEGVNTTSWVVPFELTENSMYVWRVRTYDGILHGDWMTPAAFRVNVTNEAPTAPTLSGPVDGSSADTFTPILTVNNASDPDSTELVYNFEVALDAGFTNIVTSEAGVAAGDGTTSWQVPVTLSENTTYYWRVQADDWLVEGPWMSTASFFVNTANEAPSAPHIVSPVEGEEVLTLSTDIIAAGAVDPDLDPLFYLFETDTAPTFDSPALQISGNIHEGAVETIWNAAGFTDNTTYYVRVNANDSLIESPWSTVVSFFVNTANDAPTVPVLANPSDGGAVNVFNPVLSVHNSSDLDGDTLTYEFEVYTEPAMVNLVETVSLVAETQQITSWTITMTLYENQTYYWRSRAFDGELYSGWMPLSSFMVNTANDAPGAPTLNLPIDGASIETFNPMLSINNSTDPDSDTLTYDFEIYDNGVLIQSISGIPEDISGVTTVTVANSLSDNTTYQWRARAYDGDRYGAWMDLATFSIHLPVSSITATIDLRPRTLNKESEGRWVAVYIELPQGYDVNDIDRSSILLEGSVPARHYPYSIGDHDHDGIPDLMVKFDRNDVINILPEGEEVPVTVTGTVVTTTFEGVDIIRVIPAHQWRHKPPRKRCKSNDYWKRHKHEHDDD